MGVWEIDRFIGVFFLIEVMKVLLGLFCVKSVGFNEVFDMFILSDRRDLK